MTQTPPPNTAEPHRHGLIEDATALFFGCVFVVTGLAILRSSGLVTGGMAGTALLVARFVPLTPGVLLALLNVPFLILAWRAIGPLFAVRTVIASLGIAALSLIGQQSVRIGIDDPMVAAIAGGVLLGQGVLTLVRHGAGLGGFGVLTVWLQQRFGWLVGRSQIAVDVVVLGLSAIYLDPVKLGWSALSALVTGFVVYLFHRPGRYTGFSQTRW